MKSKNIAICYVCRVILHLETTDHNWKKSLLIARAGWWVRPLHVVPIHIYDLYSDTILSINTAYNAIDLKRGSWFHCDEHNAGAILTIHCQLK